MHAVWPFTCSLGCICTRCGHSHVPWVASGVWGMEQAPWHGPLRPVLLSVVMRTHCATSAMRRRHMILRSPARRKHMLCSRGTTVSVFSIGLQHCKPQDRREVRPKGWNAAAREPAQPGAVALEDAARLHVDRWTHGAAGLLRGTICAGRRCRLGQPAAWQPRAARVFRPKPSSDRSRDLYGSVLGPKTCPLATFQATWEFCISKSIGIHRRWKKEIRKLITFARD